MYLHDRAFKRCDALQAWEEEKQRLIMHKIEQTMHGITSHCSRQDTESWPSIISKYLCLPEPSSRDTGTAEPLLEMMNQDFGLDW